MLSWASCCARGCFGGRALDAERPTVEDPSSRLWLRRDAASPWALDIPLTPDVDGKWSNKRLPGQVAGLGEVTWVAADGIRHLLPEIVLSYEVKLRRPKDDRDLAATLAVLSPEHRQWLHAAISQQVPDHPWLATLTGVAAQDAGTTGAPSQPRRDRARGR